MGPGSECAVYIRELSIPECCTGSGVDTRSDGELSQSAFAEEATYNDRHQDHKEIPESASVLTASPPIELQALAFR